MEEAVCICLIIFLKSKKGKLEERQDDLQTETEGKPQKTQSEHQTKTAETTYCCPLLQPRTTHTLRGVRGYHRRRVEKQGSKESIYHIAHRPAMPERHFMAQCSLLISLSFTLISPDVNIYLLLTTSCVEPSQTIMHYQISKNLYMCDR